MKSKPLAIIIAALLAALIIAFYGTKENTVEETPAAETATLEDQSRSARTGPKESRSSRTGRKPEFEPLEMPRQYSQRFRELLGDDSVTNEEAAVGLVDLAADPEAPIDVRSEALEHALNLTSDKNFDQVSAILSSQEAIIPETLLQTVLNDSYNRKHITQVDTSMRILRGEYSEEITEEAIELLEFHTDEQHGSDVEAWQQAVDRYRQRNAEPNENAPLEQQ